MPIAFESGKDCTEDNLKKYVAKIDLKRTVEVVPGPAGQNGDGQGN